MKNYYVLSNGRVKRENNTLTIENAAGEKKPVPIEDVESLYLYGEIDLNTRVLNFLSQKKITLHVFNYYGFYSGSYYPREYLHSGYLLTHQVRHYNDHALRLKIVRELVAASAHSMLRNLLYYKNRKAGAAAGSTEEREPVGEIVPEDIRSTAVPADAELEASVDAAQESVFTAGEGVESDPFASGIDFFDEDEELAPLEAACRTITGLAALLKDYDQINQLRGLEGKMRVTYYRAWRHIINEDWAFDRRVRRPPDNEVNALISFGNGVCYTACLGELYRTQLTPTISYLHEPGARRFSLSLDMSEIFKPLLVDRAIFRLINTGQLKPAHFDRSLDGCYLTDAGKKLFLGALEERMNATIKHRRLGRHVSYRHLIRLECYKLIRHLTGIEDYRAFRAWW